MKSVVTLVCTVVLVVSMAGAVLTVRAVDGIRGAQSDEDELYLPSGAVLKKLSLGYSGLMADIYWTRAVQYFGSRHHEHATTFKMLYPLLDITTQLDPHLTIAYEFGSIFLSQPPPEGAGEPKHAIALVERGIRENPEHWRFYYHLGYIYAIELHDYTAASQAFAKGAEIPGAQTWMKIMAANMAEHGGEAQTARSLWGHILESAGDPMIQQNALKHLRALQVDQDVTRLEQLVAEYQRQTKMPVTSFEQLIRVGWLRRVPVDPLGHPYALGGGGHVYVEDAEELPFITKGIRPGAKTAVVPKTF